MFSITNPTQLYPIFVPSLSQDVQEAEEAFAQGSLLTSYFDQRGIRQIILEKEEIAPLMRGGLILRRTGETYFLCRHGLFGGSPLDDLEKKLENKAPDKKSVFISYQWGQKELAREIHEEFEKRGFVVIRDESNLSHGVYLPGFMRIINHRNLDYVVVVVSDSYLKSKNCMYEVNQVINRYKFEETLLPFVVTDDPSNKADIYNGVQAYLSYWQAKFVEAKAAQNLVDEDVIHNIIKSCQTFTDAVRTRINVPEADLKKQKFQPFFELIDRRESEKGNDISREIEALLNRAIAFEKVKKAKESEDCYAKALRRVEESFHVEGLDPLFARLYGAHSEFLKRQKREEEAQASLEIARNFGYQLDSVGFAPSSSQSAEGATNLNHRDLSQLGKADQQALLAKLANHVWDELAIRNSSFLADASLRDFNFSKLMTLNLSGCLNLTSQVIKQIVAQAPLLRSLNLSGIHSIQEIDDVNRAPVNLRKLQELILNHCSMLKVARFEGCELSKVEFEGCDLTELKINSPKLNFLNLKDNKKLKDSALDEGVAESRNALANLNVEGCDQLTGHEFRTKFPNYPFFCFVPVSNDPQKRQIVLDILTKEEVFLDPSRSWSSGAWNEPQLEAVVEAVNCTKTLKKLSNVVKFLFCGGNIRPSEAVYSLQAKLCDAIKNNRSLIHLDLSDSKSSYTWYEWGSYNRFDVIDSLITAALNSACLRKLDISKNGLGCSTASLIATALKTNQSLTHLNLINNQLDSNFIDSTGRPSWNSIDRCGNTDALIALFRVLNGNQSLVELKIDKFSNFQPMNECARLNHRPDYELLNETIAATQQSNRSLKILFS